MCVVKILETVLIPWVSANLLVGDQFVAVRLEGGCVASYAVRRLNGAGPDSPKRIYVNFLIKHVTKVICEVLYQKIN